MSVATAPTLKTRRLTLRGPEAGDIDALAAYYEDTGHFDNIGGREPTLAEARARAALMLIEAAESWSGHGFGPFAMLAGRRLVGLTGFRPPPPAAPAGFVGPQLIFGVDRRARRRGYAFEATHAALAWCEGAHDFTAVSAATRPDNSAAVAALQKLGFGDPQRVTLYGAELDLYRRPMRGTDSIGPA